MNNFSNTYNPQEWYPENTLFKLKILFLSSKSVQECQQLHKRFKQTLNKKQYLNVQVSILNNAQAEGVAFV
jgi:hypothetical protein